MSLIGEHVLLRVYLQSADRAPMAPTSDKIIFAARRRGMAGATTLRGIMGFGYHGILQTSKFILVEHLPVIVEIVDTADKIADFIKLDLDNLMNRGMLTLERAAVMMYRHGKLEATQPLRLPTPIEKPDLPDIQPGAHMTVNSAGVLLRIFIGESDRHENKPLYEAIVQTARVLGGAGATVLRGSEGFGAHSVVHKSAMLEMSSDLPIVIEIVDREEKINALLPKLQELVTEGMITMEQVKVLTYRHGE